MYKSKRIQKSKFINFCIFPKGKHFKKQPKKHSGFLKKFFKIGMFICMLAVFITVFSLGTDIGENKKDDLWSYNSYDDFIWPIVMQDPKPFSEKIPPDEEIMLKASLWDVAMNNSKNNIFNYSEDGLLILSEDDIQKSNKKLFGRFLNMNNIQFSPHAFYSFDVDKREFLIEAISGTDGFLPHTVDAFKEKNNIVLKVGYVSPKNQFNSTMDKIIENKIEKIQTYKLKKDKETGDFYVSAVESV